MGHKSNETKEFRNTIIAMIVLVILGLLMLITGGNRLMSKFAYSRSKDVRKVTAYVEDYEYIPFCLHTYSCGRTFHIHRSLVY